jgi:ATP adenylyltransferase
MKAMDGFLFYNSSPIAGASQSHKHLQVIPVSSLPNKRIPIQEKV